MASAEQLKMTHSIGVKVMGVHDRVMEVEGKVENLLDGMQDVRGDMRDVGNKVQHVEDRVQDVGEDISSSVQGVDDKLDHVNRSLSLQPLLLHSKGSDLTTGNQLRDSFLRWLSAPDPSINHNIARKLHHEGTTQWFFQGGIFNQWKSTGSFLWVHGKRALLLISTM
jgi:uncharacterized protein YoxC